MTPTLPHPTQDPPAATPSPFGAETTTPESPARPPLRNRLRRLFLTGLFILIPVALTIYVLVVLFRLMDGIFAPLINRAVSVYIPDFHVPGLGLLMSLAFIFFLGWLSTMVGGRKLIQALEALIARIPVAKSVHGATKGVLEALSHEQREAFKRVVLIEYPKANIFALAFVTGGARWGEVSEKMADLLLVFVPTTPNPTSGFLLLVPRSEAVDLPISVEEGVRMVISGGILLPRLDPARLPAGRTAAARSA
jgi:uncharacterized membrane protein